MQARPSSGVALVRLSRCDGRSARDAAAVVARPPLEVLPWTGFVYPYVESLATVSAGTAACALD